MSALAQSTSLLRRAPSRYEEEKEIWEHTGDDVEDVLGAALEPESLSLELPKHNARAEVRLIGGFVVGLVFMLAILLRHTDTTGRRAIGEFGKLDRAFVLSTRGKNNTNSPEMDRLKLQLAALHLSSDDVQVIYAPERVALDERTFQRPKKASDRGAWDRRVASKAMGMRHLVHSLVAWAGKSPKRHPIALVLEDDAVLLPGAVSVLNDALRFLESAEGVFGNWDLLYAAHCGECLWWADALTASSTARLGGGLNEDEIGLADYAYNRSHDPGCTADYAEFRRRKGRVGTTVGTTKLPRTRQRDVAVAVERRTVTKLSGDTAALATAVDPRCSDALVVRDTPGLRKLLLGVVDGDEGLRGLIEEQFDLSLARLSADKLLRSYVIWPPVVHRCHAASCGRDDFREISGGKTMRNLVGSTTATGGPTTATA